MPNYYINIDGNNEGPFSFDELKDMAKAGRIVPATYVIEEGSSSWLPASGLTGLFSSQPYLPPLPPAPGAAQWSSEDTARMARQGAQAAKQGAQKAIAYSASITEKSTGLWGSVIAFIKRALNEDTIQSVISKVASVGIYAMVLAGLGILCVGVLAAVKTSSYGLLVMVVFLVTALSLTQYFASRFMDSGEKIIAATPTHLGSDALPEAIALITFILSLAVLALGIIGTIQLDAIWPLSVGIAYFLCGMLLVGVYLNPNLVNIAVGTSSSAGEEAIGLISFVYKSWLRCIPATFGVLTILGSLLIVWGLLKIIVGDDGSGYAIVATGTVMVFVGGLFPVIGLLVFLWGYLLVDVIAAILSLPSKLDKCSK